jgi:hypothetical protein
LTATLTLTPPSEAAFGSEDFLPASDLERLLSRLVAEYPHRLGFLGGLRMAILWKKKGGKYRGQPVAGKAQKASGLAKFWGEVDFTIWLAADHLRSRTDAFIANCLYHELQHLGVDEDTGRPILLAHDAELFFSEVADRGLWKPELEQAHEVFTQLRLIPYEGQTAAD